MKTIYYRTKWDGAGKWRVQFWTKNDASNMITKTMVTTAPDKIKKMIENELGHMHFELEQVKE